jgi:hypothetical protein
MYNVTVRNVWLMPRSTAAAVLIIVVEGGNNLSTFSINALVGATFSFSTVFIAVTGKRFIHIDGLSFVCTKWAVVRRRHMLAASSCEVCDSLERETAECPAAAAVFVTEDVEFNCVAAALGSKTIPQFASVSATASFSVRSIVASPGSELTTCGFIPSDEERMPLLPPITTDNQMPCVKMRLKMRKDA